MTTAVVVVYNHAHHRELVRAARVVQTRSAMQVVAVFEYLYDGVDADVADLAAAGIPSYATDGRALGGTAAGEDLDLPAIAADPTALLRRATGREGPPRTHRLVDAALLRWGSPDVREQQRHVETEHGTYLGLVTRTAQLLRRLQPSILLFAEITMNYPTGIMWIALGRAQGAASVVVPFGLMGLPDNREMAAMYADDATRRVDTPVSRLAARRYPSMVRQHAGRSVLRMELTRTVASGRLGLVPARPWITNSCEADAIAVESEAMLDLYRRAGFPNRQLRVVGAVYNDVLAAALAVADDVRAARCTGWGFAPGRPLVICGFPPDQFATTSFGAPVFADLDEVIGFTAATFAAHPHVDFVVNPHPRVQDRDLTPLTSGPNVRVSPDSIVDLIPLGDLYLAASSSSTIRLALACGTPVVNFDLYGYRHPQFADVPGVVEVGTPEAYRQVLRTLLDDEGALAAQRDLAAAGRERWGVLDGRAGDRLLALLAELTGEVAP